MIDIFCFSFILEFRKIAALNNLVVRVGCFCNIGACQKAMNFTDDDVLLNHKSGHVCGDDIDIVNGKPTGSIRVSFGYYSKPGTVNDFSIALVMLIFIYCFAKLCYISLQ